MQIIYSLFLYNFSKKCEEVGLIVRNNTTYYEIRRFYTKSVLFLGNNTKMVRNMVILYQIGIVSGK